VKSRLDEATTKGKEQGFGTMFRGRSIEQNPFQSVAIAVGVGTW